MSAQPARKYDFEVGVYRPPSEGGSASPQLSLEPLRVLRDV